MHWEISFIQVGSFETDSNYLITAVMFRLMRGEEDLGVCTVTAKLPSGSGGFNVQALEVYRPELFARPQVATPAV